MLKTKWDKIVILIVRILTETQRSSLIVNVRIILLVKVVRLDAKKQRNPPHLLMVANARPITILQEIVLYFAKANNRLTQVQLAVNAKKNTILLVTVNSLVLIKNKLTRLKPNVNVYLEDILPIIVIKYVPRIPKSIVEEMVVNVKMDIFLKRLVKSNVMISLQD